MGGAPSATGARNGCYQYCTTCCFDATQYDHVQLSCYEKRENNFWCSLEENWAGFVYNLNHILVKRFLLAKCLNTGRWQSAPRQMLLPQSSQTGWALRLPEELDQHW